MRVEQVRNELLRRLGGWAVGTAAAGTVLQVVGRTRDDQVVRAAGGQTVAWAAVNGALVLAGRRGSMPSATFLRRLLLVNAVADLGYIAVGVALAARPSAAPRWLRRGTTSALRGHGLAVAVQGAFLLVLDVSAAARLRDA